VSGPPPGPAPRGNPRPIRELVPHLVWEGVLLLAAIGCIAGVLAINHEAFAKGRTFNLFAVVGFVALGLALSFRTGTPNLAVGQFAMLGGMLYTPDGTLLQPILVALVAGLVLAGIVGLLGLPAWATTFAAGAVISGFALVDAGARGTEPLTDRSDPPWVAVFAAFAVLSVAGGVLFAVPAVRRYLSASRPGGDPEAGRFSSRKLIGALVGVGGSSVLATIAGILQAEWLGASTSYDNGLLVVALAAVLIGGVSPWGRRAGVLGVALGVVVVCCVREMQLLGNVTGGKVLAVTGVLALVGVLVTGLLELVGRRIAPPEPPAP
jgi:ribose/xylose/arabinose/galactoside ABC-type transport system permease subunit